MPIGQLVERTGVAAHVLRHWETIGLLQPIRVSGARRYTDDDVVRVGMILRAQAAQLSLTQIAALTTPARPGDLERRRAPLRAHLADLDRRAEQLRIAQELLTHAIDCDAADLSQCPSARKVAQQALHQPRQEGRMPARVRVRRPR